MNRNRAPPPPPLHYNLIRPSTKLPSLQPFTNKHPHKHPHKHPYNLPSAQQPRFFTEPSIAEVPGAENPLSPHTLL